jgi:hypothetical protein
MSALDNVKSLLDRLKPAGAPAAMQTGVYHFAREQDGEKSRIHLRVDADGSGLLIVNAARCIPPQPDGGLHGMAGFETNFGRPGCQSDHPPL